MKEKKSKKWKRKGKKHFFSRHNKTDISHGCHQVFSISLGFACFLRSYFELSKLLECKEFNETIIPLTLGYETGYSQLGARRLVSYLLSHIERGLME